MIEPFDLFSGVLPFFHVAEQLSFRRAAETLDVSTAAVSKAVARLEARLGVKLLSRTSRAVALTPEGKLFHARSREAVASLRAGHDQLTRARTQPRGDVHVSASLILGPMVVAALPALAARYPELVVHLELADRVTGLLAEGIDVALRVGARTSSTLTSRVLYRPRWVTVASPDFLARHEPPASPTELARCNCLRFVDPRGRRVPWWFVEAPGEAPSPREVTGNLLLNHGDLLVAAACAGAGIAQLFDFMVAALVREGRLVEVLGAFAAPGPPIHAVTAPERSRSANVRAIIDLAAAVFGRRTASPRIDHRGQGDHGHEPRALRAGGAARAALRPDRAERRAGRGA
jgi:LysR family transcriptional regulator for bpeEF and oprC